MPVILNFILLLLLSTRSFVMTVDYDSASNDSQNSCVAEFASDVGPSASSLALKFPHRRRYCSLRVRNVDAHPRTQTATGKPPTDFKRARQACNCGLLSVDARTMLSLVLGSTCFTARDVAALPHPASPYNSVYKRLMLAYSSL